MKRIKESLKSLEKTIEKEPMICIDAKGKHWFNDMARDFISQKGIPKDDFMEWIKIGSFHLHHFTYGDIAIHMMKLPAQDVIIFLREADEKSALEKYELTQKEREVLHFLVKGLSNKKIAGMMKISPGTVNTHLDSIYSKLGCSNRLAACFTALKNGLFLPGRE